MRYCKSKGCNQKAAPRRNFCYKCVKRKWREAHPMLSAYHALRASAKRRNKEFTLTFKQFKRFAVAVNYIQRKGVEAHSYHIDRIDEAKGYTKDNIQILTNAENVQKYVRYTYTELDGTKKFNVLTTKPQDSDAPF